MVQIRVDSNTSARELQESFLMQVGKKDIIKAKDLGDGVTLLYSKGPSSGGMSFLDKMFKGASEKSDLARSTITNIIDRTEQSTLSKISDNSKSNLASKTFNTIRGYIDRSEGRFLRGGETRLYMRAAISEQQEASRSQVKVPPFPGGRLGNMAGTLDDAAALLRAGDKDGAIEKLGEDYAAKIREKFSQKSQDNFVFSSGASFRKHIETALEDTLGEDFGTLLPEGPERTAFVRDVFNAVATGVPKDRQVDNDTIALTRSVDGQDVTTTYVRDRKLGDGGYAEVFLFKNPNDPADTVAVKFSKPQPTAQQTDKVLDDLGHEVQMHRMLDKKSNGAIVGFEGAFRTADGRIGIAMETAPLGTGHDLMQSVANARGNGLVSERSVLSVALTVVKRAAEGVAVQEKLKIVNADVKSPNLLLTEDGDIRLADFGTAQITDSFVLAKSSEIANPLWQAPEALKGQNTSNAIRKTFADERLSVPKEETTKVIADTVGSTKKGDLTKGGKQLLTSIMAPKSNPLAEKVSVGNKLDSWALGVILLDIVRGKELDDSAFMAQSAEKIVAFGEDYNNRAVGPNGYFAGSTGDKQVDDLINKLMHPDPSQRLSAKDALKHPALKRQDVGSDDAKALIKALRGGTDDDIQKASGKLTPGETVPSRRAARLIQPPPDLQTKPLSELPPLPPTPGRGIGSIDND